MNFNKLPKLMQDAMKALKDLHNTPEEMSLQCVLGVSNFAVQGHHNVDPISYGDRPLSEFFVCIAPTAAKKSTNYDELTKGIIKFEEDKRLKYYNEVKQHKLDSAIHKILKKKELADLAAGNRSTLTPEPKVPVLENYRLTKSTVNGIIDILKEQPYCGLFSSEAGEFFNSHAFQGKDAAKGFEMTAALTSLWDGNDVKRITGLDKTYLYNRRFNMLFLIQMSMAKDWLNNEQFAEQGFTHRILITHCPDYSTPDVDYSQAGLNRIQQIRDTLKPFHDHIYKLMSKPLTIKVDTDYELDLNVIRFSTSAKHLLQKFINTNKLRSTQDLSEYVGFAGRLGEHTIRLAGTLCAFEEKTMIDDAHLECAIELIQFYCEQRKTLDVDGSTSTSKFKPVADKVYKWMVKTNFTGSTNELRKFGPGAYRGLDHKIRSDVLDELTISGLIRIDEFKSTTNNKPSNKIVVL